jgi:putative flavoprotein involved in K+ transport
VKAPVFDETGFPIQTKGITDLPGLAFVGMPWMPSLKSGILPGVGEFAGHVAATIADAATRRGGAGIGDRAVTAAPAT